MSSSDYGPGWADCGEACRYVMEHHGRYLEVGLVPPIRRFDGRGFSAWVVRVVARSRREGQGKDRAAQASFGPGGTYKTATAALHHATTEVLAFLKQKEEVAEQQSLL